MSKISLSPDSNGTGIFTIASPNSNTNRTLTLPDDTGTIVTNSGNQAGSFTTLNTSGAVVFNDAGADVDFRVEGDTNANLLFVDASADAIGMGTGAPSAKLTISSSSLNDQNIRLVRAIQIDTLRALGSIEGAGYTTGTTVGVGANVSFQSEAAWTSTSSPANIIFNTTPSGSLSPTERARITSAGNFLVGTTSELITSSNRMEVVGTNGIGIKSTGSAGNSPLLAWNSASSGDNYFVVFYTEASITQRGQIDYNRGAGLVRYGTTSDATLKNIIGDSDGQKSLEILNTTRIREFAWKDDETQKPQIGVIAQELYETYKGAVSVGGNYEEIVPAVTEQRLVSEAVLDEDGNEIEAAVYETVEVEPERTETKYRPWGVDKTAFTFHLVAGWQAHEKIIKQQAEMIAALEARIAALETGA